MVFKLFASALLYAGLCKAIGILQKDDIVNIVHTMKCASGGVFRRL